VTQTAKPAVARPLERRVGPHLGVVLVGSLVRTELNNLAEGRQNVRVVLAPLLLMEHSHDLHVALGGMVWPHRGDGIVRVDDREDSGQDWYAFAPESFRVAAAIDGLVMMKHDSRDGGDLGVRDRSKNVVTAAGMRSHHSEFFIVEAAWFEKDAIGNANLADVVKFGRPAEDRQVLGGQPKRAPGLDGERASAVAVRERVFIAVTERS
jgi:hypothetical protein